MAGEAGVSSAWDAVKQIVACCGARERYFVVLKDDIGTLDFEVSQLNGMQEHVETRVRREMKPHMQRVYRVTFWLNRVNRFKKGLERIRDEAEQEVRHKNLRFFFPKNCCYFDRVGKTVKEKLQEVAKLIEEGGHLEQVVEVKPRDSLVEKNMGKIVGLNSTFDEVRGYMEDTSIGVIGLVGMGGVGKTTLLKMINNSFCEARRKGNREKIRDSSKNDFRSFDLVMWVDLSKEGGMENIQEAILKKLEIPEEDWKDKSEYERAEEIWRLLSERKFALLLDDLWVQTGNNNPWDLSRVGVTPGYNGNGSKVVFTTRYEDTCRVMKADRRILVGCLPLKEALELFRQSVGELTLNANHEIPQLAERVTEACYGLPLALVFMGRAMSGKIDPQEWKDVIGALSKELPQGSAMEDRVFPVLKVSYEKFNRDILGTCFLYFSVFLEIHNLTKEELIELWIAEGFLADHDGMHHSWKEGEQQLADKKRMGEGIIQRLKDACLLDSGESTNFITMHDITHAMTLWLAREEGKTENKVVVQKGKMDFAKWNDAERLSLWGPNIDPVSQTPSCHRLTTLMVRAAKLETFPRKLFPAMPGLRVLNLSYNEDLAEVPDDIGHLKKLRYLNLSGTSIKVLPLEFQNLTCLEVLLLDNTRFLETIPSEVIRGLLSLQVFSRTLEWQQGFYPMVHAERVIVDGLEILEHVYEIRISLSSADSIERLLNSPKVRKCIKRLLLRVGTNNTALKLSLARMEYLKRLELRDCQSVTEIQLVEEELQVGASANIARKFVGQECFSNLTHMDVWNCAVENMSWLAYAPKLQNLRLDGCWEIVEVVAGAVEDLFPNLMYLTLKELPKLKRINNCISPFPCLLEIYVYDCPNLKVLPFDSRGLKNLKEIRGKGTWWNRLEWTSKAVFSSKFRPIVLKQKFVIQFPLNGQKSRIKALKVAIGLSGVESAGLEGDYKDKISVIGDEIDSAVITDFLRKKLGYAELISVAAVGEKYIH